MQLKEFAGHYNVFIHNENCFPTHLNERTDFGSVPEAVMMPVQHSAGFMANSDRGGCHSIPDNALLSECTSAFSEYHSVPQEAENRGWTRCG